MAPASRGGAVRAERGDPRGSPRARSSGDRLGSPRARLFVALDLPDEVRATWAAWRDHALEGRDDLRPVRVEALHVTLAFLGYRYERDVDRIAAIVATAVASLAAPRLEPIEVRAVPPRRPRLFAIDLEDEDRRATAAHEAVAGALAAERLYQPEKRPFWPHVTFARVKRDRRAAALEVAPPVGAFEATEVTLYRSMLRPQGAEYEALERVRLGGPG